MISIKNKNRYKLIASDFDGTLVGSTDDISLGTKRSIQKWIAAGKYFSIISGRQYLHIKSACEFLNLESPQIVRGGTEIVEAKTGKIISSAYFKSKQLNKLVAVLRRSGFPFTAEGGNFLYTLTGEPLDAVPGVEYKKMEDMPDKGIAKIVLWTDDLKEERVERFVSKNIVPFFPEVEIVKSYTPFSKTWQITCREGTKQKAVLKLAKLLGIGPDEIIGIGDNYNDHSFLKVCGYKVVMENSPEELKRIADYVTLSYKNDGVAQFIDGFMGEEKAK